MGTHGHRCAARRRTGNFLDVGGWCQPQRVTEAFKIILSDDNVKAVLATFPAASRCDLIAGTASSAR